MGTSRNVDEFVGKLKAYETAINAANKASVDQCSKVLVGLVDRRIAAATGGDMALSGMGTTKAGNKKRITAYATKPAGSTPTVIVGVRGAAALIERDVKPHYVYPRGARAEGSRARTGSSIVNGKRKRYDRRTAAAAAGGQVAVGRHRLKFGDKFVPFVVASSKGRQPWAKARDEGEALFPRIFAANQAKALDRSFR